MQRLAHVAQHELVYRLAGKRLGRAAVMVRIAHHQRAIGALHGNEVNAMGQALRLITLQLSERGRSLEV